jgi:DNA-binding MarR family transcriptional regulator
MLFMGKKRLTKKELDALWGLINYPTLNDKYLAKKTNLKLSTVTAIRRRFRQNGYFQTVNIPNFYRLGYELLSVEYGPFNEAIPVERRVKNFKQFMDKDPNSIFSLMSRSNGVVLNITRNYAEANEHYAKLETFFTEHNLSDEKGWKRAVFPFQNSILWNFFDFSPVIRYSYDIKRKIRLKEFSSNKEAKVARLSKKAKRIMYGLVRYPEESDNRIADKFGVSRQAVSSLKKRFLKEDLMSTRRVMNFEYTGCSLLTFGYIFFGTKAPIDMRKKGLDFTKKNAPAFIGVSSAFENITLAALKNYSGYEKLREKILSFYKSHMTIAKPPDTLLFPVEDLCYRKDPTFHKVLEDFAGIKQK